MSGYPPGVTQWHIDYYAGGYDEPHAQEEEDMPQTDVVALPQPQQQRPSELATMRRALTPTTFAEAVQFAEYLAKSTMVPAEYRGKPENILLAMQWGAELGLAPLQAIQNIAVINGKPAVYGDAMLAIVRGSPLCDDIIETFEGTGDAFTAICEARRHRKQPIVARFSIKDAKDAKLWGKQGPWSQYPRRMLQMRARGFALRDAFPDLLRGIITREEAFDYIDGEATTVTAELPANTVADTTAALDQFAAVTGEVEPPPVRDIIAEMRAADKKGQAAKEAFWDSLSPAEKDSIRQHLAASTRTATGKVKAAEEDPFGLPPLPPKRSPIWQADSYRIEPKPMLDGTSPAWGNWASDIEFLIGEASAEEIAKLREDNKDLLATLRITIGDLYRNIQDAIVARMAELDVPQEPL